MNPESLNGFRQIKFPPTPRLSGASFEWAGSSDTPPTFLIKKSERGRNKLIQQYQWLQKFKGIRGIPVTKNAKESGHSFSYEIEYISQGQLLFEAAKNLTCDRLTVVVKNLLDVLTSLVYTNPSPETSSNLRLYCKLKLLNKLDQCSAMSHNYHHLLGSPTIIVNGHVLKNFPSIKEDIWGLVNELADKRRYEQCWIHGDLTAENILVTEENEIFLIDPNLDSSFSHPVLDVAKLWQSFHSCFEINRNIKVEINDIELLFKEHHCQNYNSVKRYLTHEFKKYYEFSEQEILLHEIIHFARLLPYALTGPESLFLWSYSRFIKLSNDLLGGPGV